jgi:hypothetical protein
MQSDIPSKNQTTIDLDFSKELHDFFVGQMTVVYVNGQPSQRPVTIDDFYYPIIEKIKTFCVSKCSGKTFHRYIGDYCEILQMVFDNPNDAMLFKLWWKQ